MILSCLVVALVLQASPETPAPQTPEPPAAAATPDTPTIPATPPAAVPAAKAGATSDFFALGRDQAAFARGLAEAGYSDLAEAFCTRVEAVGKLAPAELAALRAVHLDLEVDLARALPDPIQRKDELARIVKAKEEFAANYPDSPEGKQAEANLPEFYRLLGDAYAAAVQKATAPEEIKSLRDEGSSVFKRSEESLTKRVEALDEEIRNPDISDAETERLTRLHITASYNLARTYYFHSMLLAADELLRETYLRRCIKLFDEFSLNYGDDLLAYSGMIFKGLAYRALDETDAALAAFDECIAVQLLFPPDGDAPLPPELADVVSQAVLQKMLLLTELKHHDDAIAAANDFVATVPDALASDQGLAVLAARMNAERDSGNTAAASATAQQLVDKDPNGMWGARGRDLLGGLLAGGGSASLDQQSVLRIAESQLMKKDYEQALKLCRQVVGNLRAGGRNGEDAADAFWFMAYAYHYLGDLEEAATAYDACFDSSPAGPRAPDALYYAYTEYRSLYKQQRKSFYDKRSQDRMSQLASRFPQHPKAAENQLSQAKQLEEEERFADAAARYMAVTPESPVYQKAQYLAGTCLYQDASRLARAGKTDEAKAASGRAETQLRAAQGVLDAAALKTLDLDQQREFQTLAYQARTTIGELMMLPGLGRENDALTVAQEIEQKYTGDDDKVGQARSLKVRALTSLGKIDEARNFLESLAAKDPDSRPTAAAAGVLARSLDTQATALYEKDPRSRDGDELWKQAFRYYLLSVKPKIGDREAATSGELEKVATRFFIMGMHFNGVPETLSSVVGWLDTRRSAPEYWEKAAELYEASVESFPSYLSRVNLARTYGFLGRYREAADLYGKVIEDEGFVDVSSNSINRGALSAKGELLAVYLEMGDALLEVGRKESDPLQLQNAQVIFERVTRTATKLSEVWWRATYGQVAVLVEEGKYKEASFILKNLDRTTQDFDEGKYGLNSLFRKLKSEMEKKGF